MTEPLRICTIVTPPGAHAVTTPRGVAETAKLWRPGQTLNVRFLAGSQALRRRVADVMSVWSIYANIKFAFIQAENAEIKIGFDPQQGAWSMVGRDALQLGGNQPTLNLGWLTDQTDDAEVRRITLHETGHALGLGHEHQNSNGGIQWNRDAVYAWYSQPPNSWSRETIDRNIFQVYVRDQVRATTIDMASIMMYPVAREWTQNGFEVGWNSDLSLMDKRFVVSLYPFDAPPITPPVPVKPISVGSQVIVVGAAGVNVRLSASLTAGILRNVAKGTPGKVAGGPVRRDKIVWWKVQFSGVAGWCAELTQGGTRLLQSSQS